jgi:very-short-patch-repair endonuclease
LTLVHAGEEEVSFVATLGALARLSARHEGVFRRVDAIGIGISDNQLVAMAREGVIVRAHPGVYRVASVRASDRQRLHAALLWAGRDAAAAGRSGGVLYRLEGITSAQPEVVVPPTRRARSKSVIVHTARDRRALMIRNVDGIPTTGLEATLTLLAHLVDAETLEVACEDARRRRLTSIAALRAYLERWQQRGRPGQVKLRRLLDELDPAHPARSKLEVLTRRLLVANGLTGFVRELPLTAGGRRFLYDFAFVDQRVVLEVNGRRWHDDPADFEHDQEKWSVPARHGYRLVFATWDTVTRRPDHLVAELRRALAPAA